MKNFQIFQLKNLQNVLSVDNIKMMRMILYLKWQIRNSIILCVGYSKMLDTSQLNIEKEKV